MDCNIEGLNRTIKQFEAENIYTIGAGNTQEEAEKPLYLTIMVKNIQYLMRIGIDVLCIENMIFMQ
ncbi:CapA family protein [Staphylococcus haemolyticus]